MAVRLTAALAVYACASISGNVTARAEEDATTQANRTAYSALMKCFVANGFANGERLDAGDAAKAAIYDRQARRSYDLAYTAGQKLGLSEEQVTRDINFVQATELPKMVRDQQYFISAVATCKALHLM
ncbi:MAG: hypothetical protein GC184_13715 [Rhizobiales bacterium]|nr:hypothetical protein [Hyphomicrobiales bacterium]